MTVFVAVSEYFWLGLKSLDDGFVHALCELEVQPITGGDANPGCEVTQLHLKMHYDGDASFCQQWNNHLSLSDTNMSPGAHLPPLSQKSDEHHMTASGGARQTSIRESYVGSQKHQVNAECWMKFSEDDARTDELKSKQAEQRLKWTESKLKAAD